MWKLLMDPPIPDANIESLVKFQAPTWGRDAAKQELKATWLGHACFLVELPTPNGAERGPRILFDPVFSNRCSPSAYFGPARYTRSYLFLRSLT
jgi:N-acyl-phosphatidylethanolamine-hydrolysing phospholipase D